MIVAWVVNLTVAASDVSLINDNKQMLNDRFNMKDLDRLSYFLCIDFKQKNGLVKINQKTYFLFSPSLIIQK